MDFSFASVADIYTRPRLIQNILFSEKRSTPSTGILGSGLYTLSLYEKERTYKLALWRQHLREWNDVILLYYAILQYYTTFYTSNLKRYLYELNQAAESLEMTEQQCFRPRKRWNMRPPRGVKEKEDYRLVSRSHDTPWNRGVTWIK